MFYKKSSRKKACHLIDIADCWNNTLIDHDGNPTIGYELGGIDYFYMESHQKEHTLSKIDRLLTQLAPNLTLSVYRQVKNSQPVHTLFISFNKETPLSLFNLKDCFSHLFSRVPKFHDTTMLNRKEILKDAIETQLNSVGLTVRPLTSDDLLNWHRTLVQLPPKSLNRNYTFRSQCMDQCIEHHKTAVQIGDTFFSTISLTELPLIINDAFIHQLTASSPFDIAWCSRIKTIEKNKIASYFKRKKHILQLTSGFFKEAIKGHHTEERSDTFEIDELEIALDTLATTQTTCCKLSMVLMVSSQSLDECLNQAEKVKTYLSSTFDITFTIDNYSHLENVLSFFPTHTDHCREEHLALTSVLPLFLPVYQGYQGLTGDTPSQFMMTKQDGQHIPFSFFDPSLRGGHSLIVGQTGGGKSFLVNWMLQKICQSDEKVLVTIIDKGGSYRKLADNMKNSHYVDGDLSEKSALKLFPEHDAVDDVKLFRLQHVLYLMGEHDESKPPSDRHLYILERALRVFYDVAPNDIILEDFHEFLSTYIESIEDTEDKNYAITTLKGIDSYVDKDGRSYPMFNTRNAKELNEQCLVFDLTTLNDFPKLQTIYFFLIQDVVNDRMLNLSSKGYRQLVIYDECWSFLTTPTAAAMIDSQYRTARKYGNTIIAISQSISDFLSSTCSSGIVENTTVKFIMQLGGNASRLSELAFNTTEIAAVQNLDRQEKVFNEIFVNIDTTHSCVWKFAPTKDELSQFSRDFQSIQTTEDIK